MSNKKFNISDKKEQYKKYQSILKEKALFQALLNFTKEMFEIIEFYEEFNENDCIKVNYIINLLYHISSEHRKISELVFDVTKK